MRPLLSLFPFLCLFVDPRSRTEIEKPPISAAMVPPAAQHSYLVSKQVFEEARGSFPPSAACINGIVDRQMSRRCRVKIEYDNTTLPLLGLRDGTGGRGGISDTGGIDDKFNDDADFDTTGDATGTKGCGDLTVGVASSVATSDEISNDEIFVVAGGGDGPSCLKLIFVIGVIVRSNVGVSTVTTSSSNDVVFITTEGVGD